MKEEQPFIKEKKLFSEFVSFLTIVSKVRNVFFFLKGMTTVSFSDHWLHHADESGFTGLNLKLKVKTITKPPPVTLSHHSGFISSPHTRCIVVTEEKICTE